MPKYNDFDLDVQCEKTSVIAPIVSSDDPFVSCIRCGTRTREEYNVIE